MNPEIWGFLELPGASPDDKNPGILGNLALPETISEHHESLDLRLHRATSPLNTISLRIWGTQSNLEAPLTPLNPRGLPRIGAMWSYLCAPRIC